MDWDVGPSPSQFPSSSQWARASTRPASADMSIDEDVGYVTWKQSQPDPVIRELMHNVESKKEGKREQKPRLDASAYMSTWASSTSTSVPHRTASLPGFTAPSTNTLPSTLVSNSSRKLYPMKLISKKVPPSRAYPATAPVKDDVPPDPELAAEYLHIIRNGTAKMDENSRRKQAARAKAEKEAASGTPGDIATRRNTHTSSSGSRSTSTALTARPLKKTASISSASSSAPPRGSAISRSLSSATSIKPTVKLSRDNGTYGDIQMMLDSDRDTDREGSTRTNSAGDFAPDESFSMHVDDILPPPKRAVGRTPSIVMVPSTSLSTASSSNSGSMYSSKPLTTASTSTSTAVPEKVPQSRHVRPVVAPPTSQRGPPPLGMRRQHNLSNSGFPSPQSRYATTQSPHAASQATGQKPVTLPPFKPPLLKKPNPKPIPAPKLVVQTPESPPTSTPELDKDDSNDDGEKEDKSGAVGADSSFDVSFDVDADALEATMRQYD